MFLLAYVLLNHYYHSEHYIHRSLAFASGPNIPSLCSTINTFKMTVPEGNSEFCFLRSSVFPETKSRETLRLEGNKIHCSQRDQSLSDLLYSKTNGAKWWKTNNHFIDKGSATAVNIWRVTVNCFPFDVIVFTMLPAHGIWRETVLLLDVM